MVATDRQQLNELFRILSNPRRRYVLYYLTDTSPATTSHDLATRIAKWEDSSTDTNTSLNFDHVQSVQNSLLHAHLPKLADHGVITFSPRSGVVELAKRDGFGPFLDEASCVDRPE